MHFFGQPALPTTRRGTIIVITLLLIALVVRLALWSLPIHQPANDEVEYLTVARDLLAGDGWRFYDAYPWLRAPLYPMYLAGCLWLFHDNAQLALLPNIGLSIMQIYLLWLLGMALAPSAKRERVGLWTAALGTLLLTYATFANLWMAETLWNVLWMLTLLAILDWRKRRRWHTLIWAGMFMGLTMLTRSLPLAFLPVLALWMLYHERTKRGVGQIALLLVVCFSVIVPWTWRNWQAYGSPILVETGFAYNMWAFSEPPLDLSEINEILSAIPNPVERADYASAQGRALLSADPTIILRKPWTNSVYLWRIKPIEDRFIQTNYYSDVALPYFAAGLIFDDVLYLFVLIAAAWGLANAQRDGRWMLVILWVAYVVGSTMFTHGEARYRHFVWMFMLAYAAQTFARATERGAWWQRLSVLGFAAIPIYIMLNFYPWQWMTSNMARGWQRWQAERAMNAGDLASAERYSLAALNARPSPDGWIALGRIKERLGDQTGAIKAYQAAVTMNVDYPHATFVLGEYLLRRGEQENARQAWSNQYVDQSVLLDVAWREQTRMPTNTLDLGDGLDVGVIDGFYPAEAIRETQARWTMREAVLRLPAGDAATVQIRMANPRPTDAPAANTQICTDHGCTDVELGEAWRVITLPLAASTSERVITLKATPWQPGRFGLADRRRLGVLVDWVLVK